MAIARAWYVVCDGCGMPGDISTDSPKDARVIAANDRFTRYNETTGEVEVVRRFLTVRRDRRNLTFCFECIEKES